MPPDRGWPVRIRLNEGAAEKKPRLTWWEVTKQMRRWSEELDKDEASDPPPSIPQSIQIDINRVADLGPFEFTFSTGVYKMVPPEQICRLNYVMLDIEELSEILVKFLQISTWVCHGTNRPISWVPHLHRSAVRAHLADALEKFANKQQLAVPRCGLVHPDTLDLVRDFLKVSSKPNPAELQYLADFDGKERLQHPLLPPPMPTFVFQIEELFDQQRKEMFPRHVALETSHKVLRKAFERSQYKDARARPLGFHPLWRLRSLNPLNDNDDLNDINE